MATPEKNTGTALILCPGGGYRMLDFEKEAIPVALRVQDEGTSVFVLKYRVAYPLKEAGYRFPFPIWDAQRAVRLIRFHAQEWGIQPDQIGIIGFSAGGHLVASAGTHFKNAEQPIKDDVDGTSTRPDFMVLIYPVISSDPENMQKGSFKNLFGTKAGNEIDASTELLNAFSAEKQVTVETTPTWIATPKTTRLCL